MNRFEITRAAFLKAFGRALPRQARLVPTIRNGEPNGFKLHAILPGSVYRLLGMRDGDTIHSVNGHAARRSSFCRHLSRKAKKLTIRFTRAGRRMSHVLIIR